MADAKRHNVECFYVEFDQMEELQTVAGKQQVKERTSQKGFKPAFTLKNLLPPAVEQQWLKEGNKMV